MSTNDGGPAFPMPGVFDAIRDRIGPVNEYYDAGGMTLRDYFAAKAMQAMIPANPEAVTRAIAIEAYAQADAMLAAREQTT